MKWQQRKKQANEITKYVNLLRGEIIAGVIHVESNIDVYLSLYFTNIPDRQGELTDLLFSCSSPSMAFETKRNLLANLFQRRNMDNYKQNKDFFDDLSFIIKHRNVFAHYLLNTGTVDTHYDDFKKDKTFYFIKYKLLTDDVPYTPTLIKEIKSKIKYCIDFSNELLAELIEQ